MKICPVCHRKFDITGWECPFCQARPKTVEGFLAFAPELAQANDGFPPQSFELLAHVEASNFWFRSRNRLLIWALSRYFPHANNFLEIGCGTGFVLNGIAASFPHLTLSGSDIYSTGLPYAAKRLENKACFLQMDARAMPFAEEFDIIGAFDVLEHIHEDQLVLAQMYQAARPQGGIVLTVPQHPFLWSWIDEYSCHVRRYRAQELKSKVERAGFRVVKMTSFVSFLLPLMLLSRWRRPKKIDPGAELTLGVLTNFLLEKVLDFEQVLRRLGITFPWGGSLLLVARKV